MAYSSVGRRRAKTPVYLNVYDLAPINEYTHSLGVGFYHSGVEISGKEYTFAASAGIFDHTPKAAPPAKFREQIEIGTIEGGLAEVQDAIQDLNYKFGPNDYNILENNCNHFSKALCWKLTQKSIPAYVNRTADVGACCSCLVPKQLLEGAPVNEQGSSSTPFLSSQGGAPTTATMTRKAAFTGRGARLGGTSGGSSETEALTDRREKARMAAMARLNPQRNNEHDE